MVCQGDDRVYAAQIVAQGGVIAYPTEGVYGLGCLPQDKVAVERIYALKRRNSKKPLLLVASHWDQVQQWVAPVSKQRLADVLSCWPGPITWIFPAASTAPSHLVAADNTIALRVSNHPTIVALCQQGNAALVSTSANVESQSAALTVAEAIAYFDEGVDYYLHGELGGLGRPTQIREVLSGYVVR